MWFGRDPLGRRSLLLHRSHENSNEILKPISFLLCSVATVNIMKSYENQTKITDWIELPPDQIYCVNFPINSMETTISPEILPAGDFVEEFNFLLGEQFLCGVQRFPWIFPEAVRIPGEIVQVQQEDGTLFQVRVPDMFLPYGSRANELLTSFSDHSVEEFSHSVRQFLEYLSEAVRRRVVGLPEPHPLLENIRGAEARLGIMFSGGIDSTFLAALASRHVPRDQPIE